MGQNPWFGPAFADRAAVYYGLNACSNWVFDTQLAPLGRLGKMLARAGFKNHPLSRIKQRPMARMAMGRLHLQQWPRRR